MKSKLLLFFFFFFLLFSDSSMAESILFSKISGNVVISGAPISNATVKRWYLGGFNDKEGVDLTTTDASGGFFFPAVAINSFLFNLIPHEAVISQKIFLSINGKETIIYATVKRNYIDNGEYGGKPLIFTFDPSIEPTFIGPSPGICITLAN